MKNIIITGSSNGFGYLSAMAFAEQGYRAGSAMTPLSNVAATDPDLAHVIAEVPHG